MLVGVGVIAGIISGFTPRTTEKREMSGRAGDGPFIPINIDGRHFPIYAKQGPTRQ
jgi:hypothetical protein